MSTTIDFEDYKKEGKYCFSGSEGSSIREPNIKISSLKPLENHNQYYILPRNAISIASELVRDTENYQASYEPEVILKAIRELLSTNYSIKLIEILKHSGNSGIVAYHLRLLEMSGIDVRDRLLDFIESNDLVVDDSIMNVIISGEDEC